MFTGNPVFWLNGNRETASGHLMIISGYNSAGVPVFNAHNGDAYHYPITGHALEHTLYTFLFHCEHIWIIRDDEMVCNYCKTHIGLPY